MSIMSAIRALSALAVLTALASPPLANALSIYPCHSNKHRMGDSVSCRRINLPRGLCSACPLRPTSPMGEFLKCWDIFDTSAPACLSKMLEYVAANPCDRKRAEAVAAVAKNPADRAARATIDYFLYSVCELCCDSIPMGARADRYSQYLAAHTLANPTLYTPMRGNSAAHAWFDICKVAPNVTHFAHPDDPPHAREKELRRACGMLDKWGTAPESREWMNTPRVVLEPDLVAFLSLTLEKLQCTKRDVWDQCYILEAAQGRLALPGDIPKPLRVAAAAEPVSSSAVSTAAESVSPTSASHTVLVLGGYFGAIWGLCNVAPRFIKGLQRLRA